MLRREIIAEVSVETRIPTLVESRRRQIQRDSFRSCALVAVLRLRSWTKMQQQALEAVEDVKVLMHLTVKESSHAPPCCLRVQV